MADEANVGTDGQRPDDDLLRSAIRKPAGWAVMFLVVVVILVLAAATLPNLFGGKADSIGQIFGIVIGLLLVLGALAGVAAYLGVANQGEAFGLPGGTIRAVLALGLLIAFIVFGVAQLDRLSGGQLQNATIVVPWAELDAENAAKNEPPRPGRIQERRRQLERLGLLVTAEDSRDNAVRFEALKLPHPDYGNFSREILTMLGTLLASILSFYFGSRAVETGANTFRYLHPESFQRHHADGAQVGGGLRRPS